MTPNAPPPLTPPADALLWAHDLHKAYRKGTQDVVVLDGACVALRCGEMVGVVGASGAGKSTLLHVLGTLDAADRGTLAYRGESLLQRSSAQLAAFRNRQLGFVFQFHHLLADFDAVENVMMPALIARMPAATAKARAREVLQEVGLGHRLHHRPGELSGGEQQRVALARALVMRPPLLLADEVTGNLDGRTAEEIHTLLFDLNARHKVTVVVVTHNRQLAARMPRCLQLAGGKLEEATP